MTDEKPAQAGQIIPILRSFDEARAKGFYIDWLGGALLFEHRFDADAPLYFGVALLGAELHVSEHHGDATPGGRVLLRVADVDAVARDLRSRPYRFARPGDPQDQAWGYRELTVADPFGARITFFQPI